MAAEVDLVLNAKTKKAEKAVDGLKTALKGLGAVAAAAASAFAFKKVVEAANKQEQAIKSLNTALAVTGEFSEENSKRFQEFASELQKNSTVGDEVSLSLIGLAKSMGATNDQTEQIIQAAADMSAMTGETLEGSVKNLAKTLGGLKGELGETQPELAGLTAEQLKAGKAIDIISQKYEGAAKSMTQTFGGSIDQATNSFGDLLEEVGFLITKNPIFIKAINLSAKAFARLGEFISDNRDTIINYTVKAIAGAVKGFSVLTEAISPVIAGLKVLGDIIVDGILVYFSSWAVIAVNVADTIIKAFKSIVNLGFEPFNAAVGAVGSGLNALGIISDEQLTSLDKSLKDLNADSETSGLEALKQDIEAFNKAALEGLDQSTNLDNLSNNLYDTKKSIDSVAESSWDFAESIEDIAKESDKSADSLKKLSQANEDLKETQKESTVGDLFTKEFWSDLLDDFTAFFDKLFSKEFWTGVLDDLSKVSLADVGSGIAQGVAAMTKGAAGAHGVLKAGAQGAAMAFGADPQTAAAIAEITSLLAQGPEQTRAMIQEFVDEIPVIINNLAEALPVLIEVLTENADEIIIALVKGSPKIARAIAIEVPKAFAKELPGAIRDLFKEAASAIRGDFAKAKVDAKPYLDSINKEFANFDSSMRTNAEGFQKSTSKMLKQFTKQGSGFLKTSGKALEKAGKDSANAIGKAVEDIKVYFTRDLPATLKALPGQFQRALLDLRTKIYNAVTGSIRELVNAPQALRKAVIRIGPDIEEALKSILRKFDALRVEVLTKMTEGFRNTIILIANTFASTWEKLKTAASSAFEAIKASILKSLGATVDYIKGIPGEIKAAGSVAIEQIKTAFTSLANSIKDSVNGVITSITDAFNGFITAVQFFIDELPNLPDKIIDGIESAIIAIGDGVETLLTSLADTLWTEFQNLGDAIVEPIKQFLKDAGLSGENAAIGGSGKGSVESAIGVDIPGVKFARGGEVPGGFPNDSFPSLLTSGENVIDRTTNQKLNAFLDGSGGQTKVVIQVGEQELASVLLNLNRQGFRTA